MNKLTDCFELSNGVKVPCIGYGTYLSPDGDVTKNGVKEALNIGYRHVDTAFAYGNFHHDFIKNHITLIGCPKLDEGDYAQKLTAIIKNNNVKSVKVVRMEVPCCSGIENAVRRALQDSGKFIPWQVIIISTDGNIIEN